MVKSPLKYRSNLRQNEGQSSKHQPQIQWDFFTWNRQDLRRSLQWLTNLLKIIDFHLDLQTPNKLDDVSSCELVPKALEKQTLENDAKASWKKPLIFVTQNSILEPSYEIKSKMEWSSRLKSKLDHFSYENSNIVSRQAILVWYKTIEGKSECIKDGEISVFMGEMSPFMVKFRPDTSTQNHKCEKKVAFGQFMCLVQFTSTNSSSSDLQRYQRNTWGD